MRSIRSARIIRATAMMLLTITSAACAGRADKTDHAASQVPAHEAGQSGTAPETAPAAEPTGGAPEAAPAAGSAAAAPASPAAAASSPGSGVTPAVAPARPAAATASAREAPGPKTAAGTAPAAGNKGASGPAGGAAPVPAPPAPDGGPVRSGPTRYDSGADDKQIVFGSISGLTGVIDAMRPEAARAYFKFINDQGGVNGRKLVLKIYDDQWDVTRNAALHRQAFEQDKVFAFVSSLAPLTTHGGVPFVEANRIPVIGGDEVDLRAWPVSPYYYATGSLEALHGGGVVGRLAVQEGCKRLGAVTWNIDESRKVADSFLKGVKAAGGGDFAYRAESGLAETDFTAYAVQIKQANVDCMTVPMFDTYTVRLKQALRQVGHPKVRFYQVSNFYTPLTRESGLFEGDYGLIPTDVVENAPNNPAMAEFLRVVAKYEPGLKDKINGWAMKAYAGAQLAVEALKRAGNNLTRDNILDVLNGVTNLDLGTVPPLTFRPGNHEGGKCGALVQVKNSQFLVVKRWLCA